MWRGRPYWAEIDLDAIEENVRSLRGALPPEVAVAAVVKANAYGHGAVRSARAALAGGATWLAVNLVDEGVELRRAGLTAPVLVLGYLAPWEADKAVFHRLTPTVNCRQQALALATASQRRGVITPVHVKVDTGLNRYGLPPEEVVDFVLGLRAVPYLAFEGLWTHFATADEADPHFALRQIELYQRSLRELEGHGVRPRYRHAANSAGALQLPSGHFDIVRCGVSMYGLYPSAEVPRSVSLRPAMTLKGTVARVRRVPPGASVGYGRTFVAERETTLALLPGGYGDGIFRALSNVGQALVEGRRARVVGRVSMDQLVLDVTDIAGVEQGAEVVLLGRQGEERITAEEIAGLAGTIHYEVVTAVSRRVPRVYLRGGEVVAVETLVDG